MEYLMLTEAEIEALEGEALDRAVAEYVMGEPEPPPHEGHETVWQPDYSPKNCWCCLPEYDKGDVCEWEPMIFSTAIVLAWRVVEHICQTKKMWCEMRTPFGEGQHNDGYWCGFTPHLTTGWNGRPDGNTQGSTLPIAICRAALKVALCKPA